MALLSPPSLCELALELQVEIILELSNPTPLARCARHWYVIVNTPFVKAKWLIRRHGKAHALFHAVRMSEPFINVDVVECLFAQKAHLSRYFVQERIFGIGKSDSAGLDQQTSNFSDVVVRILKA